MSYNVRLFNQNENIKDDNIDNKIIDAIKKEKPNILCIQEFICPSKEINFFVILRRNIPQNVISSPPSLNVNQILLLLYNFLF